MSTFVQADGDNVTQVFNFGFPYLKIQDVTVSLDGIVQFIPMDGEFISATAWRFVVPPKNGQLIEIRRLTEAQNELVTYQNGAILLAGDLNTATLQTFFRTQELQDQLDAYYNNAVARFSTLGGNGSLTAGEMIEQVANQILNSQLLADLQTRIVDIDANAQSIIDQSQRLVTAQTAIDALTGGGAGIITLITNEQDARINGDTALVTSLNLIGARSGDNLSWIMNTGTVRISPTETLATRLSSVASNLGANAAAIGVETTARTTADSALASTISSLTATVTSNNTTLNAAVSGEASARATADTANANLISALTATVTGNNTAITAGLANEQTVRANADTANASSITALAASVSGLPGQISANTAAILTEQSVRASADSANATSISTLSTTVAGNTASISTQATSIGGLSAQYTVKVDVNGYVAGYGLSTSLFNGTPQSDFIVLADKFAIVTPGSPAKVPFIVSGGTVFMQNVVIQDALIDNLNIGKLQTGFLNADMMVGTGKVVWANGVYMKVTGIGFGSANQFIDWFGPYSTLYTSCTEANAITYLKTDGTAYFGGSLLAGVFRNSVQGTILTSANIADCGPFSSNGGTITVNFSFTFHARTTYAPSAITAYNAVTKQSPSAVVVLSRSLNGGAFVDVATMTVSGGSHSETAPNGVDPGFYQQIMGASSTYVDSGHVAQSREFKLRFTSWANVDANVDTNTLTIITTE
jgi:hypothetical protein